MKRLYASLGLLFLLALPAVSLAADIDVVRDESGPLSVSLSPGGDFVYTGDRDTCDNQYPGDLNGDGVINIYDLTFLMDYLYFGGPPPEVQANADPNGDCCVNYEDIHYLIDHAYLGGPPPVTCTCVDPQPCLPAPPDHVEGTRWHNLSEYDYEDIAVIRSLWQQLYPQYDFDQVIGAFLGDDNDYLSTGDTVVMQPEIMTDLNTREGTIEKVALVTTTMKLIPPEDQYEAYYLDLIDPVPEMITTGAIPDPRGTFWLETYPVYGRKYVFVGPGEPIDITSAMTIHMQVLNQPDSGLLRQFDVAAVDVDMATAYMSACDCDPSDPNNDGKSNILDIVYLITHLFKEGSPPQPYEICSGDVNADCAVNILDVIELIWLRYKCQGGPCGHYPRYCGDWVSRCGLPLQ